MTERNPKEDPADPQGSATDGDGQTRRTFLGAAALATGGLLATSSTATAAECGEDTETLSPGEPPEELPPARYVEDLVSTARMELFQQGGRAKIEAYPHQRHYPITAELGNAEEGVRFSTYFEPDEAREFAAELEAAADEVEQWRRENWEDPQPEGEHGDR